MIVKKSLTSSKYRAVFVSGTARGQFGTSFRLTKGQYEYIILDLSDPLHGCSSWVCNTSHVVLVSISCAASFERHNKLGALRAQLTEQSHGLVCHSVLWRCQTSFARIAIGVVWARVGTWQTRDD